MFSKTWCPYCAKAKRIFNKHNMTYTTFELDETRNGFFIEMALFKITKHPTVPIIFIGGVLIGGSNSLEQMEKNGGLSKFDVSATMKNENSDVG